MGNSQKQHLVQGTMLLAFTSLIVKVLSAIYRVPFQNLVGDEGFYVYQQVYPIYGIAMTLALSGVPIFLSRVVAEQPSLEQKKKVVQELYPFIFWLSFSCFILTFVGSNWLALKMGDGDLANVIRVVSFVFLFTPTLSIHRGFFQGELFMRPTALSQLYEQAIRVSLILLAAYYYSLGKSSIYTTGTLAMVGSVIGALFASRLLRRYYKKNYQETALYQRYNISIHKVHLRTIGKRFMLEGSLICLYSSLLIVFQLVDSFVVKNGLVARGMPELEAKMTKGAYDRGQPLVQLGLVIATALTATFMPMLSKYLIEKKQEKLKQLMISYQKVVWTIASAASFGLITLLGYVNRGLFGDNDQVRALQVFVFAILLMSLVQVYQTILQSIGFIKIPIYCVTLGIIVKMITAVLFTKQWGTIGSASSTLLGLITTLSFLYLFLRRTNATIGVGKRFVWLLFFCLLLMVISLVIYQWFLQVKMGIRPTGRLFNLCLALGGVGVGGFVFLLSVIRCQLFSDEEWAMVPKGMSIKSKFERGSKK